MKETLALEVNFPSDWSLEDAKALYVIVPEIRAICSRVEHILLDLTEARSKLFNSVRMLKLRIEVKEDEYVGKNVVSLTGRGLSWEERGSFRRTASLDERLLLAEVQREYDIVHIFRDAVDKRYGFLLSARKDIQAMANLLKLGSILREID